jgi:hypothetical protein
MNYYTETLSQALTYAQNRLDEEKAVPVELDWANAFQFDGVPYGTNKSVNIELALLKGKPTRKWAHLTVWRLDSGRYEWNVYIL